ncbi:predicted protein [Nematostella vectensis]|uniref:Proteasome maturation protein n=1 Tax=Nematostella vectensis TaxID=45351 RepID=A7RS12_NEMVE|nr:predicted protein [Nematostella vectensis]|eukprot:XP_001637785.1 predicted protein [Nematostella vectensis]
MAAGMSEVSTILPKAGGPVEVVSDEGLYGVPDKMKNGFSGARQRLTAAHPLEYSEINFTKNQERLDMKMLRNTQGLHAPLKLQMERAVTSKIRRLPCLPSSMVALDTVLGTDDVIGFEDYLGDPLDQEVMGDAHSLMERKLGIH